MEVLSKPEKIAKRFQVTKIKDKYGVIKINLRYYSKTITGKLNFQKSQQIYMLPDDWELLKAQIRKKRR